MTNADGETGREWHRYSPWIDDPVDPLRVPYRQHEETGRTVVANAGYLNSLEGHARLFPDALVALQDGSMGLAEALAYYAGSQSPRAYEDYSQDQAYTRLSSRKYRLDALIARLQAATSEALS